MRDVLSLQPREPRLGWRAGRLSDFLLLKRGVDITEKQTRKGNVPVYSSSGISYYHSTAISGGPGVVTGRKGSIGQVFYVDGPYWPHDTTLWVTDFCGNLPEYVWRFLEACKLERFDEASSVPTLNRNNILSRYCVFPPYPEQRKIVEILRAWDEAIEALARLRSANLRRRVWLRSHIFTGRIRLPGFSGEWCNVPLSDVLTEHGLRGTGAEEVFSVSVHKGLINQIEHLGRSFAAAETGHYNRVLPGDIVYTKSPTGDFALGIIKQSKIADEVIVSPLYGVFTPASRSLGVILDALFESPIAVRNYLSPLVQKGAKNTIAITNRRFLEGKLRLPMDPKEQAAIAEVIVTSQAELAGIEAEVRLLTEQKRGLMQKLLTGEWRVKVDGDEGVAA